MMMTMDVDAGYVPKKMFVALVMVGIVVALVACRCSRQRATYLWPQGVRVSIGGLQLHFEIWASVCSPRYLHYRAARTVTHHHQSTAKMSKLGSARRQHASRASVFLAHKRSCEWKLQFFFFHNLFFLLLLRNGILRSGRRYPTVASLAPFDLFALERTNKEWKKETTKLKKHWNIKAKIGNQVARVGLTD